VLVSGLQGSGKTTKARKIKTYLEGKGKTVRVIPPLEFMAAGNYIDLV
jgi:signal recognition particle GTPase